MLVSAAIERMRAVATDAADRLTSLGYIASVEVDYMNSFLQTVESEKRAKFITVSVVISSAETPKGDEYCLSLGAEVRGGKVDDAQLEGDITDFTKMVTDSVDRLSAYESKADGVGALAAEANKEYEALVARLHEDQKKQRMLSALGLVLVIIGVVVLFVVATLGVG